LDVGVERRAGLTYLKVKTLFCGAYTRFHAASNVSLLVVQHAHGSGESFRSLVQCVSRAAANGVRQIRQVRPEKLVPDKRHEIQVRTRQISIKVNFKLTRADEPDATRLHGRSQRAPIDGLPRNEDGPKVCYGTLIQIGQPPLELTTAELKGLLKAIPNLLQLFVAMLDGITTDSCQVVPLAPGLFAVELDSPNLI
jgi:hypothetical protein